MRGSIRVFLASQVDDVQRYANLRRRTERVLFVENLGEGRRLGLLSLRAGSKGMVKVLGAHLWQYAADAALRAMEDDHAWGEGFVPADNVCVGGIVTASAPASSLSGNGPHSVAGLACFPHLPAEAEGLYSASADIVLMNADVADWFWDLYRDALPHRHALNWREYFAGALATRYGLDSRMQREHCRVQRLAVDGTVLNCNTPRHIVQLVAELRRAPAGSLRRLSGLPPGAQAGAIDSTILGAVDMHSTALVVRSSIRVRGGRLSIGPGCTIYESEIDIAGPGEIPRDTLMQNTGISCGLSGEGCGDVFYFCDLKEASFVGGALHTTLSMHSHPSVEMIQLPTAPGSRDLVIPRLPDGDQLGTVTLDKLRETIECRQRSSRA